MQRQSDAKTPDQSSGIVQRGWIALAGALLGGTLVFANEVIAARFLGLHLYGCYALAFTVARVGEVTSMFGLRLGVLHFIPIYRSDGRSDRVFGTIIVSLLLPIVAGLGIIVVIWTSAPWLAREVLREPDTLPYLRAFALVIPLLSLTDMLGHITRAFGHAIPYVIVRNLVPPAVLVLLLGVLVATEANPLWIVGAVAGSYAVALIVGVERVATIAGPSVLRVKPELPFREVYAYSFPLVVNAMLYVVLGATDLAMLGGFRGTDEVGIYRGCMQLLAVFQVLFLAFNSASAHIYPVLVKEKRQEELDRAYSTTNRWMTLLAAPAFVLILLNAADLLSVLGPGFSVGATALGILLLVHLLRSCTGGSSILLVLSGHQKLETFNAFTGVCVNVILDLLLVPDHGMAGAAVATLAAHVTMNGLRTFQVRKHLGVATLRRSTVRILTVAAVVAVAAFVGFRWLGIDDGSGLAAMALRIPVMAIVLASSVYLFGIEPEDRDLIAAVFRRVRAQTGFGG